MREIAKRAVLFYLDTVSREKTNFRKIECLERPDEQSFKIFARVK